MRPAPLARKREAETTKDKALSKRSRHEFNARVFSEILAQGEELELDTPRPRVQPKVIP